MADVKIDEVAFRQFMAKPAPRNEAKTIEEYAAIIAYWDEREPQTGMPRGLILDEQVIQEIPAMHKVVFGAVQILTHPDAGQIYEQDGGGLGLSAGVYFSIAQAAGMSFPDEYSTIDVAASSFPDRVVASAAAIRTDLAGQIVVKSGRYVLDVETKCAKLEKKKGKEAADRLRMNLRESNVQRAITGAQRAAIKAHYGKLRRKWVMDDFEIPLIIPRLIVDKSMMLGMLMQTEAGQQAMASAFFGAQQAAFGAPRRALLPPLQPVPAPLASPGPCAPDPDTDDDDDEAPQADAAAQPATKAPEPKPEPVRVGRETAPQPETQAAQPRVDKAREWRAIYAIAAEAGYTTAQKAEVEAKAKAAAIAAGAAAGASSETWTAAQWTAARECFKQSAPVLPEDEPEQTPVAVKIPETLDAFVALPDQEQVAVLDELLRTRVLGRAPTKQPSELKPEMRAKWFDGLRTAPVKGQEAA